MPTAIPDADMPRNQTLTRYFAINATSVGTLERRLPPQNRPRHSIPTSRTRRPQRDIKAGNEAIEITWLKSYLDFSPSRPTWAKVTDLIINAAAPPETSKLARFNTFLQSWNSPTMGPRLTLLNQRHCQNAKHNKTRVVGTGYCTVPVTQRPEMNKRITPKTDEARQI